MLPKENKKIMRQMFDVRPVNKTGDLDLEKIEKLEEILRVEERSKAPTKNKDVFELKIMADIKKEDSWKKDLVDQIISERKPQNIYEPKSNFAKPDFEEKRAGINYWQEYFGENDNFYREKKKQKNSFIKNALTVFREINFSAYWKPGFSFAVASFSLLLIIFSVLFIAKSLETKNSVFAKGQAAYSSLAEAREEIAKNNFQKSTLDFNEAYAKFEEISMKLMPNLRKFQKI